MSIISVGLSCLAPDIVQSIIDGRQRASFDQRMLLAAELPLDRQQQRLQLGLA